MRRPFIVAAVLVSALAFAGCNISDRDEPKPTRPSSTSAPKVLTTVDESTPSLKEGRDYSVIASWPQVIGRRFVSYRASRGKNHAIAVLGDEDAVDPSAESDPRGSRLVEVDIRTAEVRSLAIHGTEDRALYMTDVVLSGDTVVWTETDSTVLDLHEWDIYSLDLGSMKERHLASSRDFGVENPPPPSPTYDQQIVVVGDSVYFPAVDSVTKDSIQSSIYSVPLTVEGSSPKVVARSANQVFADGNELRVMLDGKLVKWDPVRGVAVEADKALDAGCGAFFGEGVAVLCRGKKSNLFILTEDGAETGLDVSAFDFEGEPAVTGYLYANARWVGFTVNGSQGYIFDLARKAVFKLDGVSNSPEYTVVDHWVPNAQRFKSSAYPRKLQFLKLTEK